MGPPVVIRVVVLDLGGVVFRYRPERRFEGFARLTGLDPTDVRKRLMDSGYSRGCDAGRLNPDAAYREGLRLLGTRMTLERFRDVWISAFDPDTAVVELARQLKAQTSLAMLSNNSTLVAGGLEARYPEVMELFRPRLFSAEAGILKPDPRLFRTLLDLVGESAERVLYVDDEPVHVAAAGALGMQTCRFTDAAGLAVRLDELGLTS